MEQQPLLPPRGRPGVAVETAPETGFLPTAESLAPHLADARLLALNSPLNPAGTGFAREQLRAIAQLVVDENRRRGPAAKPLFLFYDQIYWLLADSSAPHTTPVELVPEVAPYTLFVDGISKAFAATGLRVGWAVGPPFLISRMKDFLGHVGAWAPRPEQVATAELFADPALVHCALRRDPRGHQRPSRGARSRPHAARRSAASRCATCRPPVRSISRSHFDLIGRSGASARFENNRAHSPVPAREGRFRGGAVPRLRHA